MDLECIKIIEQWQNADKFPNLTFGIFKVGVVSLVNFIQQSSFNAGIEEIHNLLYLKKVKKNPNIFCRFIFTFKILAEFLRTFFRHFEYLIYIYSIYRIF